MGSTDLGAALKVAAKLKSGRVMLNSVVEDPLAPRGGRKSSGDAREWGLYSHKLNNCADTICMPSGDSLPVTPVQNMGFSGLDIGAEPRALHHAMAVFLSQKRVSGMNPFWGFSTSVRRSGS